MDTTEFFFLLTDVQIQQSDKKQELACQSFVWYKGCLHNKSLSVQPHLQSGYSPGFPEGSKTVAQTNVSKSTLDSVVLHTNLCIFLI